MPAASREIKAAQLAIKNPLIDNSIEGAKGILLNISGGPDLKLHEVNAAAEVIRNAASPEANIIFGAVIDRNMDEQLKVTIIAAGFRESGRVFSKNLESEMEKEIVNKTKTEKIFNDKEFDEAEKLAKNDKHVEKVSSEDFKSMEEDDYLDIPTFLRKNKK